MHEAESSVPGDGGKIEPISLVDIVSALNPLDYTVWIKRHTDEVAHRVMLDVAEFMFIRQ